MRSLGFHRLLLGMLAGLVVAGLTALPAMAVEAPMAAPERAMSGMYWLTAIQDRVVTAHFNDSSPDSGKLEPYLKQLQAVRNALREGNGADVYKGLNRFLDMLESRANGISAKTADDIFDYTFEVTPVKFINQQRYKAKYRKDTEGYMDEFMRDVGGTR